MMVSVNSITGFEDAFVAMFLSKRTWTPELDAEIRRVCCNVLNRNGLSCSWVDDEHKDEFEESLDKFNKWLDILLKMGRKHITVLRFIDISIMTGGLHRAGQDDVDAHAKRFDNRIIRSSTRLATYNQDEQLSSYYKDKVITDNDMFHNLKRNIPEKVYQLSDGKFLSDKEYEYNMKSGILSPDTSVSKVWVKTTNGYVLEEYANNKDVKRGLYMLGIPSNFVSKINLAEWGHVFKQRNKDGGANPEVKEWAEVVMNGITEIRPEITRDYVLTIDN